MPSVPVLPTSGNISLDTSQGYRRVQADASAFGGREAQALGAVGQGLDAVAHAADEIDQEQARTEALQADNAYAAALRERLRGPDGYLNQRGENAVNQRAQVEAGIDELAVSTLGNVRNPRARALAEQALRSRAESALGQISEHAANQTREFQVEQIGAAADVASRNAIDAILANDEGHAAESLASANAAVTRLAQLNGWDDAITTERRQALADSITHNVVVELASTDPERARAYFEAHPVADPTQRRQTLAAMMAEEARAMRTVSGTVYRDFASGANYRNSDAWRRFTTDPLFGDQYMAFQEHVRTQALQSVTMSLAQQERISRHVGDELLSIAADERGGGPHALDLIVQAGQGRLGVVSGVRGPGGRGQSRPLASVGATTVMSAQAFERETGMSYSDAQQYYRSLRGDALTEVLNRVNEASAPQALDASVARVLETAEAYAESAGVAVTGQSNAQNRARLRTYVYTRVRALAAQGGQIDELARDQIAREAVAGAGQNNRVFQRMMPYEQIPIREREAIERELGPGATPAEVESVYAEYLVNGQ